MTTEIKRYKVWDRTTRIFHWINAISVILLMLLGTLILNADRFQFESEVFLKTVHSIVGYVFVVNLLWRLIWGFIGGHYARWRQVLPVGPSEVKAYLAGFSSGKPRQYLGHNPMGRLIITAFFLVLTVQGATGLVIAGTDLYSGPFGSYFANWVTEGDPARLAALQPGDRSQTVEAAYTEMRAFRRPIISTHVYGFYTILTLFLIHIIGVIVSENREKNGLVSAMITGEKVLDDHPVDGQNKQ
jgi:Ni/Fe-hydrogenase 1 B-type cytochrome subunit